MRAGKQKKAAEVVEFANDTFRSALKLLLERGIILGYLESRRNSTLDQDGVDWLIYLRGGLAAVMQIKQKTSGKTFRNRLKKHLLLHPHIINVFGIEKRHTPRQLARRIVAKINRNIRATNELILNPVGPEVNKPSETTPL